ncbi:ribonuclease P protein subunit p29-like [Ptychodera flava]|uniref:ribonuclease P protein subunit p29-like n=1 Tax=Ptychodera flava TaxID=63121 RepID=UPI00396A1C1B
MSSSQVAADQPSTSQAADMYYGAYNELPKEILKHKERLGLQEPAQHPHVFIQSFLKKSVPDRRRVDQQMIKLLSSKAVVMDVVKTKKNSKTVSQSKKKRVLNAKERRKLKIYDIKPEHQRYVMYEPLYFLWQDYIKDYLDIEKGFNKVTMETKLQKADYHGSIITVTKSKCPSYVGISGIVVQETKNVWKIITKENKLKTIPKANTIFCVEIEGIVVTLYGNHLRRKSSERSVKKFKSKNTIDL